MYYEALDLFVNAIKLRFSQLAFQVSHNLETLLLKAAQGEDSSKEIEKLYQCHLSECSTIDVSSFHEKSTFTIIS